MIREELAIIIERVIKSLQKKEELDTFLIPKILIEHPKEKVRGDYSTNIALNLSKKLKKNPMEIADKIISQIGKNKLFEKIEVISPGFINFYLSKEFFINNLKEILKTNEDFGKNINLKNQKVIIEYTDPNPFKVFHIGHLSSNSIGESLSRIFEFQGAKVTRVCYQGDVGLHVAKALWTAGKKEREKEVINFFEDIIPQNVKSKW